MWASMATDDRSHRGGVGGGVGRMKEMTATPPQKHMMRRRWQDEEGFFCRWMDGQECDSSVLLCYSFSCSCTDPGWVYSGSLSCRGSGPSRVPSSSGPSSPLCGAWSPAPRSLRRNAAQGPLHNPSEGGAEVATSPIQHCSVHTHMHTHAHTYSTHIQWCRGAMQTLPLAIPISSPALLPFRPGNTHTQAQRHTDTHTHSAYTHSQSSAHLQFSSTCFSQCSADWRGRRRGREGVSGEERR